MLFSRPILRFVSNVLVIDVVANVCPVTSERHDQGACFFGKPKIVFEGQTEVFSSALFAWWPMSYSKLQSRARLRVYWRTSLTIRPSSSVMILSAISKMRGSCVTMIVVVPRISPISLSILTTV